jgi:DNA topoisomerase-2
MKAPEILSYQGKNYTRISFLPDFKKFGIKSLSKDIVDLFKKRVYDLGGILKCKVYLNNKLLALNSFEDYAKLYCP